jgi:AcrR family transcriptional regulator
MDDTRPFAGEPATPREAIMRATFFALQEHGYAGLSIQRIADEAAMSKSTFYHHFEDKEDLLLSFVDFMNEQFLAAFTLEAGESPRDQLETLVELVLEEDFPSVKARHPGSLSHGELLGAYVEVRAQAVNNEAVRATFTERDRQLRARVSSIIRAGIETGDFAEAVDPDRVAAMTLTLIGGYMFGAATADDHWTEAVRSEFDMYVENRLVAEE